MNPNPCDIDLGGEVCGVVNVVPERILGDNPIDDVPVKRKPTILESRNPVVDVRHYSGEPDYVLTLVACIERSRNVRFTRKALSDCVAEQMSVKRVDKVRVYLRHQQLMSLQVHVLHSCNFARIGVDLVWERDLTKREQKPAALAPKSEKSESTYWEDRLAACRERLDFARRNNIQGNQVGRDLDDEAFYLQKIAEEKAAVNAYPELDAAIKAAKDAVEAHAATMKCN